MLILGIIIGTLTGSLITTIVLSCLNDENLAKDIARADTLMRRMRRFAVEENAKTGIELNWNDGEQDKYYIYFDYDDNELCMRRVMSNRDCFQIFFATSEIARKAHDTFKDELMWYFTEYKDHLC